MITPGAEGPPAATQVIETHSSVLLFLGERVYKFRKPVDLGFLDFRDVAARQVASENEVRLNRRLSPDVYLACGEISGGGEDFEPVVVMRRLPDGSRLSHVLAVALDDDTVTEQLRRLARLLASFHGRCETSAEIAAAASMDRLRQLWADNVAVLRRFAPAIIDSHRVDAVDHLSQRFLAGRGPLIADRQHRGLIRDGHGDLLADDIFLLPDGPRVLDCLDFDPQLRYGDVLNDVTFLAMDLERLGHPKAARLFLRAYGEFSAEHHPRSLEHFYIAYRASVRAKVTCLRWEQACDEQDRSGHAALVHRLVELCLKHLRAAEVKLVLLGGLPGTGKSTVAAAIADNDPERDWTVLSSDMVRKELAGLAPTQRAAAPFGAGLYSEHRTRETYLELFRRAKTALAGGENVILDASFINETQRQAARAMATGVHAAVLEIRCDSPAEVVRQRLARRSRAPSVSDADEGIFQAMRSHADPWPTALTLDTCAPPSDTADQIRQLIA